MTAPAIVGNATQEKLEQSRNQIWLLQYGPCWCHSHPTDSSAFDYVRSRRTVADLGDWDENLLIVSARVIDGSNRLYRQVYTDMPDPKVVVAVPPCPAAGQFWDELPNGWRSVEEVIPVDIRTAECMNGFPESLMAAVLSLALTRSESSQRDGARSVSLGG